MTDALELSVVISTYNRPVALRRTLSVLEQQTLPASAFEVIVVDDGSQAECRAAIREYQTTFNLKMLEKEHGGQGAARNLGADHAAGRILCFLDDDVVPGPDALTEHLRSHEKEPGPLAVVGSLPFHCDIKPTALLWYLERRGHYDLYQYAAKKYPNGKPPLPPMNGNSSVARDVFMKVGKYDESFSQYGGEDLELGYRLARSGVKFVYNPLAVGYHLHEKDFSRFCADMEKSGESLIRIYRKFPEIKEAKKIHLVENPIGEIHGKDKITKIIASMTLACPWLLALPRLIVRSCIPIYSLRHVLFPMIQWIAGYHYAAGMRKGLREAP